MIPGGIGIIPGGGRKGGGGGDDTDSLLDIGTICSLANGMLCIAVLDVGVGEGTVSNPGGRGGAGRAEDTRVSVVNGE